MPSGKNQIQMPRTGVVGLWGKTNNKNPIKSCNSSAWLKLLPSWPYLQSTSLLHLLSQTQEDGNLPVLSLEKQQEEGKLRLWYWDLRSNGFQSVSECTLGKGEVFFLDIRVCLCMWVCLGRCLEVLHTDEYCICTPEVPLYVSPSVNIAGNTAPTPHLSLWKFPSKHPFLCCASLSYWAMGFILTLAVTQLQQGQGQLSLLTTAGVLVLDLRGFCWEMAWVFQVSVTNWLTEKPVSTFERKATSTLWSQNPSWQPVSAVACLWLGFADDWGKRMRLLRILLSLCREWGTESFKVGPS